jgi:crotonobetainyl-CoA:carnitine CoA-transferase CaiB-like acyl-CoA transferase
VLALHEVADDAQANAIGLFPRMSDASIGDYRTVRVPMRFATADVGPRGPAPGLGEHSLEVLRASGYGAAEIEQLIASGVVAAGGRQPRSRK